MMVENSLNTDPQNNDLHKGWQTFSKKGQITNILGFESYAVSVTTIKLCIMAQKHPDREHKWLSMTEFQ